MFKIKLQAVVLAAIILFFPKNSSGQTENIDSINHDKIVFWFPLKATLKLDRKTKKPRYILNSIGKDPKSGTLMEFEINLFKNIKRGKRILIGPFDRMPDARRALPLYKLAKHTNESMEKQIINYKDSIFAEKYYWFFFKRKSKRKYPPVLERTAARVASGDLKDFKQVLWEGFLFKQLAIGPFTSQEEAEEAKRLYRLEED